MPLFKQQGWAIKQHIDLLNLCYIAIDESYIAIDIDIVFVL